MAKKRKFKITYDDTPLDVANRVRNGVRTVTELKRCGCTVCLEALKILDGE